MSEGGRARGPTVERIDVSAYTFPTDAPESDGTLEWDSTTLVLVEARGGGQVGLGYTYNHRAAAALISQTLGSVVEGGAVLDPTRAWEAMVHAVRNMGRQGVVASAISAVDAALWDLKARVLGLPLVRLLGQVHARVPVYGSGGFTSYSLDRLQSQLGGWAAQGIGRVKMKVGREPGRDPERVARAREAIGPEVELFVDANGAYTRKEALRLAEPFAERGVRWYEEPVSSDDLEGLRLVRDRAPASLDVAAGEYGWDLFYFRRMLEAEAVDVLQADVTRCLGVTGFLHVGALCRARGVPLSAHCAPAQHAHPAAATSRLVHLEYFHDHTRIEDRIFDGLPRLVDGALEPDLDRPGNGLVFKRADAERFGA